MLDVLVFALVAFILTAAGRQMLSPRSPAGGVAFAPLAPNSGGAGLNELLTPLERNLLGFGLGLGVFGYGMLALGLAGLLTQEKSLFVVFALFVLGTRQWPTMALEIKQLKRPRLSPVGWGAVLVFALFALTAIIGVYSPPTQLEWDALAYHLADPKIFIQHGRIIPLPWESHSEFAFNTEMWYTFGLLNGGVPLAKWFHAACAIGAALTLYAFGRRFFTPVIGVVAALVFVSTPLVFWEAGAAYADLATTFFTALTGLAVALWIASPQTEGRKGGLSLLLPAAVMGLTLATKATALTTLGLLAVLIVGTRARTSGWPRALSTAAVWAVLALTIGCPYFVKSTVRTGNPVYPFYYQIFGGRGWSADRAQAYDASNAAFGQGRRPVDFLLLPYNLTMSLVPNRPLPARADAPLKQSFNDQQNLLWTLSPMLLAALFVPLFMHRRVAFPLPRPVALYALGAVVLWFLTAQHVRYLLPTLPALCLLAACAIVQAWESGSVSGRVLAAFGAVSVLFALALAGLLVSTQGPVALGLQTENDYLAARDPAYDAMQYLNTQTPPSARVALYGNPLGFYCDRAYFWGDRQHSAFVPYDDFHAPADFLRWLKGQGVTHLLVNRRYFNPVAGGGDTGAVYSVLTLCGPPVYDAHGVQVYQLP